MSLIEAYAAGWALVEDAPVPSERNLIDLIAPASLAEALDAGERQARRATLEAVRLRLYRKHSKQVKASATTLLLAHVPIEHLAAVLVLMGDNTSTKRSRATQTTTILTAATLASPTLLAAWQGANADAWAAAVAQGRAEAEASVDAGPPDPKLVAKLAKAADVDTDLAPDWQSEQLGKLAWHLSSDELVAHEDPEALIRRSIEKGEPITDSAEDLMHEALSRAFVDWFNTGSGTTLGQLWFVTEQDDVVCPFCLAAEAESPYITDEAPRPPVHPSCRCHLERG